MSNPSTLQWSMAHLRSYTDNKAVVASSQKGLQQLMDNLNKVTREFGMKINVMCISRKGN